MPMDAESRRLIDWMEKGLSISLSAGIIAQNLILSILFHACFFSFVGVYDALQKKYLKTLLFCVCEAVEGPMIEEYACKMLQFKFALQEFVVVEIMLTTPYHLLHVIFCTTTLNHEFRQRQLHFSFFLEELPLCFYSLGSYHFKICLVMNIIHKAGHRYCSLF